MARYEHAGKFWTIARSGAVVTITSGKLGNKGRTVVKHHANEAAAIAAHDQLVRAKHGEGFRLATEPAAPAAEVLPVDTPDAERGEALVAAIAADPDDANGYLVYGDWLQRHGDPHGELIALHAQPALAGKHIATHAARLLGRLAARVPDLRNVDGPPFTWRYGFVRRAELRAPLGAELAELFAVPAGKLVVELALRTDRRTDVLDALQMLGGAPPTLREVDLFASADLGRFDVELPPSVERLAITARTYELARLALPDLRRAKFFARRMSSTTIETIAAAPWPVLERLELRFCGPSGSCEADFHDVRTLLVRTDLPALTHLRLRGCPFAGTLARTLATSPLARQLEVLDFSHGHFTPNDIASLAKYAGSFPELRELWVPRAAHRPELAAVAKHVIPDSRIPADTLDAELSSP